MGDGRLLPLLALLGAAVASANLCARLNPCANGGTCFMVGSAWTCHCPGQWRGKRCQAGLELAELTEPSPRGPLSILSSSRAAASRGSWDPGPPPRAPPWPPSLAASGAVETPAGSTAAEGTSEAGGREPPTFPGRRGQPPPATPAATRLPQAWLSPSTSPAGATGPESSPSLPSTEGVATSPFRGSGTGVQVGMRPPVVEPTGAAGRASVPPSLHPASSPRKQAGGARPPHRELPGPSLAAAGWPVTGAPLPGPSWSAHSGETLQEEATAHAELTDSGSAAPQTVGLRRFLWQRASSEGYGEPGFHHTSARPPEPWPAGGFLLAGTAPPESPAPPRPCVEPELMEREAVTPGDWPGGVSLGQRSSRGEWEGPAMTLPLLPSSSSSAAPPPAQSPGSLPSHTGHVPVASQPAPTPSPPSAHEGLSAGPTGGTGHVGTGQDARWTSAALQTSAGPLTVPGTEPPHPSMASFSGRPSPVLALHPTSWVTEGGPSSKPPSSSGGTSAVGLNSDSPQRPPAATPQGSFPPAAAWSQGSPPAGETTATAVPTVPFTPGGGEPTTWRSPGPAAPAAFTAKEDSGPSRAPRLPLQTALSPTTTPAVVVPASQVGKMEARGQSSATHRAWSAPAGTWGWSRGGHSTGSLGREVPPSLPVPTVGTTGHTWPPARGDPPVASTWLLAVLPEAATQLPPATPREVVRPRVQHVFVAENQPPALKAAFLHLPWELVLATTEFPRGFGSPPSPEYRGLLLSINATVAPFFAPLPGFQRLEVKSLRPGGVVVLLDAVFQAEAPGWWAALNRSGLRKQQPPPGMQVANASVVEWSLALERPLDLCAELFSCPVGYDCVVGEDGHATCASVCHRQYCKNQGICTHATNQTPVCQCPVGSDFWFLGVRCDYRVTQQGLLGVAGGLMLSLLLIGAAVSGLVVRRVRLLLLEARADQSKSSYRRFCRLDDVSAHYWSEPWLASVNSLDNPAFTNSEEALETPHCTCPEGCLATEGYRKPLLRGRSRGGAGRPRSLCSWERSSGGSGNEHMIDSGKASEVSVSSWPMEPIQWSPSPAPHEHAHQPTHKTQRPHSYCEGMELASLERSWTA